MFLFKPSKLGSHKYVHKMFDNLCFLLFIVASFVLCFEYIAPYLSLQTGCISCRLV